MVAKAKVLCLHGFRNSGKILERQLDIWPESVREIFDFVFLDAPFPAEGKSGAEGKFDPPYYEWFQCNEDCSMYMNFDECIACIEEHMQQRGPFDGVLGFSQGGLIAAALPGMQAEGVALNNVPKIKFIVSISGGKLGGPHFSAPQLARKAFSFPLNFPSLHFIGEKDFAKQDGLELIDSFINPSVIYHHEAHGVPELDEKNLEVMLSFIEKIQSLL